ncbi:protein spartin [Cylas formicarius]|uniref:protein spartin n=1 Tax=Cylas formicarius TaxID=197179 RepID=UPI002958A569|nr:protein spartin [Cylas formicarius]XP_060526777.1 protein spartin [Cylas formicarius]
MGNANSDLWTSTYLAIKNKHDQAFAAIEQAISLEERDKPHEALEKYKEGISLIDQALNIQVQCPDTPDVTWDKACQMVQKIKKTRAEVLTRIHCIQSSPSYNSVLEDPPSYEEAMSSSDESSQPVTYRELAQALNDLSLDPNLHLQEDVIYTYHGVRLYFISPSGEVLSTQEPQILKISLVEGQEPNAPRAILQIGEWVYPLVPGVSPCYRTDYGAFILPDVYSEVPGSSVGIILPSDADEDVFDLLENILHGIITQETEQEIQQEKRRREQTREDVSTKISNKLVDGAWYLSQGLIRGAEKAGNLIDKNTPKLINSISRVERASEVNPTVSKGLQIAETATSKAAKVTGFVAEKVGYATVCLGQYLAPHIQKQGTKLLTRGFNMPEEEASEKVRGVLTVAAGAVEGFSTIYRGLETSAAVLGRSLKDNTVKVVEHKYGTQAAGATESGLNAMGNTYCTYRNAKFITPKSMAKTTGAAMVHGYSNSVQANMALRDRLEAGPSASKEADCYKGENEDTDKRTKE